MAPTSRIICHTLNLDQQNFRFETSILVSTSFLCLLFGSLDEFQFNWKILIISILIAPILEELVFRGLIQSELLSLLGNKPFLPTISLANILTSVAFISMHYFTRLEIGVLWLFIPSLLLGVLRERHNSVIIAIFFHAWFNLNYIVFSPPW